MQILQSVVGHRDSCMYPFWQQLTLLQHYIELLGKSYDKVEDIVLSKEPKAFENIYDDLQFMLKHLCKPRRLKADDKMTLKALIEGFQDIKRSSFMDKLWTLLTCKYISSSFLNHSKMNVCILDCDSVGDLKKSFNIVFEEIANNRTIQIYVSIYKLLWLYKTTHNTIMLNVIGL